MRVLLVIEDLKSGSGECVRAVARSFSKQGHNVSVLTKTYVTQGDDWSFCQLFCINNAPEKKGTIGIICNYLLKLKVLLLYCIWPIKSFSFYRKAYKKAINIINNNNIDVVICVYNSIEVLLIGHKIKKKYKNDIIFVPYFLDAFYGGHCPRFMPEKTKKRKALSWERKLLYNADGIVMMTPAYYAYKKDNIKPYFLDKTVFLDLPLYSPLVINETKRTFFSSQEVVLLYAGSMPNNVRNPEYFLSLFKGIHLKNAHLYIAGTSDYQNLLEDAVKKSTNIHLLGQLSHDKIIQLIKEADYLVNIGNSLSYMVPCKIFEYMSLGKSIISTYRINDDPSLVYLPRYHNSLLIDERLPIGANISKIEDFLTSRTVLKSFDDSFLVNNRPETFVHYIENIHG